MHLVFFYIYTQSAMSELSELHKTENSTNILLYPIYL